MLTSDCPALLGGTPAISALPDWPTYGETEQRLLAQVLESRQWWALGGSQVAQFERDFAARHASRHAVAVTNGTHAIALALRVLGIGRGDEVIVPAQTYVATAMAVAEVGATPVPVDVLPTNWCIDPAAVGEAITSRTRAVVPVHFAGHPANHAALDRYCGPHAIPIIEDAAHAHGARSTAGPIGSLGDMAAFSFQNFKLMAAGEGGIVLFRDAANAARAARIANGGRTPGAQGYPHEDLGSNYRMTEFQGAVLRGQLERLETFARQRVRNGAHLDRLVAEIPGVRPQAVTAECVDHARYMYVFTYEREAFAGLPRERLVDALRAEGLPASRMYPTVQEPEWWARTAHQLGFDPAVPPTPVSKRLAADGVWLHHRVLLGETTALVEQVAAALDKVRRAAGSLREGGR